MADTIESVAERLAKLEVTVARGFDDAEQRDLALSQKIDVQVEALRGDTRTVLDAISSLADEMRRTTDSIRKEHAAHRVIFHRVLGNHSRRIYDLENK